MDFVGGESFMAAVSVSLWCYCRDWSGALLVRLLDTQGMSRFSIDAQAERASGLTASNPSVQRAQRTGSGDHILGLRGASLLISVVFI